MGLVLPRGLPIRISSRTFKAAGRPPIAIHVRTMTPNTPSVNSPVPSRTTFAILCAQSALGGVRASKLIPKARPSPFAQQAAGVRWLLCDCFLNTVFEKSPIAAKRTKAQNPKTGLHKSPSKNGVVLLFSRVFLSGARERT